LLGPCIEDAEVQRLLDAGAVALPFESASDLDERVAALLQRQAVVGWVQGPMEFGPRALGSRSILGDPRDPDMQTKMNLKIKFRESFRPFAPAVLRECAAEYFEMGQAESSPYMLLVAPVNESKRRPLNGEELNLHGIDKLKVPRSEVPAITHVDYSARVQTVDRVRHGRYRMLLEKFEQATGCPVVINTSFNVRGEPIVCTPEDAYRCFMATNMDVLVLERFVLLKEEQPESDRYRREEYLAQFALD
ncbi:MAG: hypothetical protein D6760_07005, partial [Deltaproteobacteria bacterium]